MKWLINIPGRAKNNMLTAEVIYASYQIEQIHVFGESFSVLLQNNRPLLVAIELDRPLTWKHIQGELNDTAVLAGIINELEKHLEKPKACQADISHMYAQVKQTA
jgi:hypothetical protein